jgi:hypothetical protein
MNKKRLSVAILAIAAALAVSAVGSTAASAGTFKADSYPATIKGEQSTQLLFTGVVGTWKCTKLAMVGELAAASGSLTLAPQYEGCSWAGIAATISMNGCTYKFNAGETVEGKETKVKGTMDIVCPAGKEMVLVLNGGTCTIRIAAQTSLNSVILETAGAPADVSLVFNVTGIKYVVENGAIPCPNSPANGTYTNGSLAGSETLQAEASGKTIGFRVV